MLDGDSEYGEKLMSYQHLGANTYNIVMACLITGVGFVPLLLILKPPINSSVLGAIPFLILIALLGLSLLLRISYAVTLYEHGIVFHRLLNRHRFIPYDRVESITVARDWGFVRERDSMFTATFLTWRIAQEERDRLDTLLEAIAMRTGLQRHEQPLLLHKVITYRR